MVQTLQDAAKAILRRRWITIQSYLKNQEKSQMNNLTSHLKQPEKEEQTKPKIGRRKGIIKTKAEINKTQTGIHTKQQQRSLKLKAGSLNI